MNKVYRLVWNQRSQSYVAASERASSRGRVPGELSGTVRAVGALAAMLLAAQAHAVCGPSPTLTISSNQSSTVTTSCPDESVVVDATIDAGGSAGLLNGDSIGSLTISATGQIRGQDPVLFSNSVVSGDITNNGLIQSYWSGGGSGFGNEALELDAVAMAGTLTNNGSIGGDYAGVRLAGGSTVPLFVNTGTITSDSTGVVVDDTGTVLTELRNAAGGTIHGGNDAAVSAKDGAQIVQLTNAGTLTSNGTGILLGNATATAIVNEATGQVQAPIGIAILEGSAGSITNAGQITGSAIGLLLFDGVVTGAVTNAATGVITGGSGGSPLDAGISMGTMGQPSSIHTLINQGRIEGSVGIDGQEGSVISHGIDNQGTIEGGSIGIRWTDSSALTGGITNAGTISGANYAIDVGNGASIDRIDLVGTSAQLIGDVRAAGTDVNVKTGAVFTTTNAFDVRTFNVETGGRLNFTNAPHTTAGLSADGIRVDYGFDNAGTVVIGASTLARVHGSYSQAAGGALHIGVDSLTTHGVLAVSGDATFASGSTLKVLVGSGAALNPGDRVEGVVTAGGVLAVPGGGSGLTLIDDSVQYNFVADTSRLGTELDLLVQADETPYTSAGGGSRYTRGVAANLDRIQSGGVPPGLQPVFDRLGSLTTPQAAAAMGQLVPVLVGAGPQAGVSALRSMNKIIQSRIESNQGLSSGNAPAEQFMWVRGFGTWGEQDDQDGVPGFDSQTSGIVIGADAPLSDRLRAGVAFTYARSDIDGKSANAPSSLDVDTYELVTYGSYNIDPVTDVNYQIDVGYNKAKGERQIVFMGTTAKSSFDSLAVHGSLGVGRTLSLAPRSSLTPSVRADYTHMRTGGYTESGAGALSLDVDGSTFEEFMLTLDLKGSHSFNDRLKLVANVSAGYDLLNKQVATQSAFVDGGTVFETKGLEASPWLYRAGAALMHDGAGGVEYSLRYDVETRSSGYLNQTVSARLRWAF